MGRVLTLRQQVPRHRVWDIILPNDTSGQQFKISGPTQIGRSEDLSWKVGGRDKPVVHEDLEVVITVTAPNGNKVSRNHAAIALEGGNFVIHDLNSTNGTYVNLERLVQPRPLRVGDVIGLAATVDFDVVDVSEQSNHYALLVGHDGGNLRGVANDLKEIRKCLEERGYKDTVTTLHNQHATKKSILEQLSRLNYVTTADSRFIFYFSGHGNKQGISVQGGILSPDELYGALNIRGKKAIILDCCHSGIFLGDLAKKKAPVNSLVICASVEDGLAQEGRDNTHVAGGYLGKLTEVLLKYFIENQQKLDLSEFEQYLHRKFQSETFNARQQRPIMHGKGFTLLSCVAYNPTVQ